MELRKDYILDRWVIISSVRNKRPKQFISQDYNPDAKDFFAPGNEHLTPPEIGRIPDSTDSNTWKFRWFPNKFPFVAEEGNPHIETHNGFFTFASAFGKHEVVVETPDVKKQLWDLKSEDLKQLFMIYNSRIEELSKDMHTQYVSVFKNHGKEAGTSLIHAHTQIASLNFIPKHVREECNASKNIPDCPYCRILNIERGSHRRCFENTTFLAFTPYASRFNYEIWIFPKRHLRRLNDMKEEEYSDLADIMYQILSKLKEINAPFNYYLHYSPEKENLHFHIEVTPRLAKWAGFEHCTGTIINAVPPEDAAAFYRGEISLE